MTPTTSPAAAWKRPSPRWIGTLALALLLFFAIGDIWLRQGNWKFEDVRAYWDAAMRLREGLPLYAGTDDPNGYSVFRYAPWFAWLWVPLTYLPRQAAELLWAAALAASSLAVLGALVRLRSTAAIGLAILLLPMFHSLVQVGNVQPLVVAILAFGISRRSGPLWVAVAASLKATPILYGLVYAARREWLRLLVAVAGTAVLLAPVLITGTAGYETDPGASDSLYYYASPLAWAVAAGASVLVAAWLAWRRSDWLWVALAVAVSLCAPRAHFTYATFLVVGMLAGAQDRIRGRTLGGASGAASPRNPSVRESS